MQAKQRIPREFIGTMNAEGGWWAGILFTHARDRHDCKIDKKLVQHGRVGWRATGMTHKEAIRNIQKTAPRACIAELLEAPQFKVITDGDTIPNNT